MNAIGRIRRHPDGRRIVKAVRDAQAEGWVMTRGQPFPDPWPGDPKQFRLDLAKGATKCCCPLSALNVEVFDFYEAAELELGWSHDKSWAFSHGFDRGKRPDGDNDESNGKHEPELQLGRAVRLWLEPGAFA